MHFEECVKGHIWWNKRKEKERTQVKSIFFHFGSSYRGDWYGITANVGNWTNLFSAQLLYNWNHIRTNICICSTVGSLLLHWRELPSHSSGRSFTGMASQLNHSSLSLGACVQTNVCQMEKPWINEGSISLCCRISTHYTSLATIVIYLCPSKDKIANYAVLEIYNATFFLVV